MDEQMKETFVYYYEKYYKQAILYTSKKIQNKYDVEDLVMDAFFVCYVKYDTYDSNKATFATWFYYVLNNRVKNYYRDHRTHEDIDNVKISIPSVEDEFMAACNLAILRNQLAEALLTLNANQRKMIILKYFKNKNSNEIGNKLGITAGNVRIQIMRGMNKMREYLEKNYNWEN